MDLRFRTDLILRKELDRVVSSRKSAGLRMINTPDYAIEIHAKALAARFRGKAEEEAELHAKMLKKSGDNDGYEVWMMVAKQIKRIKKQAKEMKKTEKQKEKEKKLRKS